MFKPSAKQFATPIRLQHRVIIDVNGASEISYEDADPALDLCAWKGKGGTESVQSGTLVVSDTAELTMWYRPDVTERDQVLLNDNSECAYEVMNAENIEMRNQFMMLKVKRVVNA